MFIFQKDPKARLPRLHPSLTSDADAAAGSDVTDNIGGLAGVLPVVGGPRLAEDESEGAVVLLRLHPVQVGVHHAPVPQPARARRRRSCGKDVMT